MVSIEEVENPFDRYIAFVRERESIRIKKGDSPRGDLGPWTEDRILQSYRFTNVNRENDRVSKHYQKLIRDPLVNDPLVLPATVLYRWFNRPETCEYFFNTRITNHTPFEEYIEHDSIHFLEQIIEDIPTPHVTGAFIIQGKQGYTKGLGVLQYFHSWCRKPWREAYESWSEGPPTLEAMFKWLMGEGLGSFMTAQLVADLKYLPFMLDTEDWWTWAAPGPGSMRGLNAVLDRPMMQGWNAKEWLVELHILQEITNPILKDHGIAPLHAQDLQNTLCEFSKYEKTRLGLGRPRQVYR